MERLACLFPGQGSQYSGMGRRWYKEYSIVRRVFEEASEVLKYDLKRICFEGETEQLADTRITQPAIVTLSVAAYQIFVNEVGITPAYYAGHSLGEYSALCCAGVIRFDDMLRLVQVRGQLMYEAVEAGTGLMQAIRGVGITSIYEACEEVSDESGLVTVANVNSNNQVVISGHRSAVIKVSERLQQQFARASAISLQVGAPFHSPLMVRAAQTFRKEFDKYTLYSTDKLVISNLTGLPYRRSSELKTALASQISATVQWKASMDFFTRQGIDRFVELGPGTTLRNLLKNTDNDLRCYAFDDPGDLAELKRMKWAPLMPSQVISWCLATAVATPNRGQQSEQSLTAITNMYKRLQTLKKRSEKIENAQEEMIEAITVIKQMMMEKGLAASVQCDIFDKLMQETTDPGWV
ncbi:ACP S-malonyltransferase [Paenibacillus sp. P32E]|uniref:ACP S-malonyltransferase n=1 Tax=Paenibacillus sp. P32E TaxID=1349434 RepID=UPI00093CA23A|nr:ACP S-malonyltransferase [Paenibacillus sp. P32E]